MDYKNYKLENDKYRERIIITSSRRTIICHFVFDLARSKLQKKFSIKIEKFIPGLKSRLNDIKMTLISSETRDHGIHRVLSLWIRTSINTTREHYNTHKGVSVNHSLTIEEENKYEEEKVYWI